MVTLHPLQVTLEDVCFCHWPVAEAAVQTVVPGWLTVETADGDAWVSAVAATVEQVEAFGFEVAGPSELLTVRTYVRGPTGQRGVRVLALLGDDRRTATAVSELFRITVGDATPRTLSTADRRRVLDTGGRRPFECRYTVAGDPVSVPPDSLASFLVDRQRYFTTGRFGTRLVGSVGHDPWRLDRVDAAVTGTVFSQIDISAPVSDPLVHHSPSCRVSVAPPVPR